MKERTKKILKMSALLILLVAIIIGGFVLAKYFETINGSSTVDVAKWNVELGQIELSNTHYTADSLKEGTIAPGTSGSFNVVVDATGTETGVDYNVSFTDVTNVPANMYFKIGNTEYSSLSDVASAISGHISANDTTKRIEKTVEWIWDYQTTISKDGQRTTIEANDAQDTLDGETAATMSFNVVVTASQSLPTQGN